MENPDEPTENKYEEIDRVYGILSSLFKLGQREASDSEPRYVISIAARMVGTEAHTLRYYERLGLVQPGRSGGNIRLYSQDDVDRLCCFKALMNDVGVNLAGLELALHLMRRMEEMQEQVGEMKSKLSQMDADNLESDAEWRDE